jgi:DNA-binding transcriptional MocR family regulator
MSASIPRLDETSGRPAYQQIADHLTQAIRAGRLAPGDRLPAIRTLAADLGLHRDTVALAYEQLANEGWVAAQVGRGTFVAPRLAAPSVDSPRALDPRREPDLPPAPRPPQALESPQAPDPRRELDSPVAGVPSVRGRARAESAPLAPLPGESSPTEGMPSRGTSRDLAPELRLAESVEGLIALSNTRPRYATGDDVIALHKLIPDPRFYPTEAFRRCLDATMAEDGPELFSYASPEGDPRLRRAMAERMRRQGIEISADELVLCHGASQGISLALRLFASPGERVAVEVPTYANVLSACTGLGLDTAPVPMDDEGPEPDALDRLLARPEVKAFYTIPSFHNPLGSTTTLERRRLVLEIARRHRVPVIEDGFEMDLRFRGPEIPSLAALDEMGGVVLLFSFSKSLFPGIRVGSISARGRALEGLVALKHATDLSDALPIQAALARFVESGAYDRHLDSMREVLRARHEAMEEALGREMPDGTTWTRPDGGYQCWVELPFDVDTRDVLVDAAREGVLFSPGTLFMPDARSSRAMRLTVACADEDEIRRGVAALGRVTRRIGAAGPGTRRIAGMHL